MTILVDTQHGAGHSGDLAPALRRHINPKLIAETFIEFGDAAFAGNGPNGSALRVGIEIKHVGDVLACIEDGRFAGLGGQLEGMANSYDVMWLLIEDELRPDSRTGELMRRISAVRPPRSRRGKTATGAARRPRKTATVTDAQRWVPALFGARRTMQYADLMKWLASVQFGSMVRYGKPLFVWRTGGSDETAQWVVAQYQFWQKKFELHRSMNMFNVAGWNQAASSGVSRKPVGFTSKYRRRRALVAAAFDGISYDRGMNLASRFPSVEAMVRATEAELVTPASGRPGARDGIGKQLAAKLWTQFREKGR